ncbi:nucleoside-diphosphate-sugar epimerase [Gluconobacter cerinus]|uniref:NAD-dependent epimerase/dehydratase family protein n=1 Tax=Gluconobacter cerinus TaxID=38307 RepID=UPI002227F8ED|nr:NAD(P)-dependent oxidoreductase [Gluconobacter cerinus]MCW2266629.1 nucleoside-diphosphate-sugar epimerase [Gluconobacter cerinus]
MKIFVAGASGALGRCLIARLKEAGHGVWGMAHRAESLTAIEMLGAHAVKADALNREALFAIIEKLRPDVVIDELTSLPASPFDLPKHLPIDRKLRLEGGGNLFDAAQTYGVKRYIQQSCGFYLDAGYDLATEASSLRMSAPGNIGESARMYTALEARVRSAPTMEGVTLRYGFFYGPGTWYWPDGAFSAHLARGEVSLIGAGASTFSFVHVDDAAQATVSALTAKPGVYNIVDNQPLQFEKWLKAYARWVGAPVPPCMTEKDAVFLMGEESVYYQNSLTGACNRKAMAALGFSPRKAPWLSTVG